MSTFDTQVRDCSYCIGGFTPAKSTLDNFASMPYQAMQETSPGLAAAYIDVPRLDSGPLGPGYQLCTQCATPCPDCNGNGVFSANAMTDDRLHELTHVHKYLIFICDSCVGILGLIALKEPNSFIRFAY